MDGLAARWATAAGVELLELLPDYRAHGPGRAASAQRGDNGRG
nr:hypothetical protein [Hymenobacter coccineus]